MKKWRTNFSRHIYLCVIEVTLIVVVLVGLAVLFNSELNGVAEIVFKKLKGKVESI